MWDGDAPALDEQGVPAAGVTLGEDGSITVGAQRIIGPVPGGTVCRAPTVQLLDGTCFLGSFVIPTGGLAVLHTGEVHIGRQCMLGPCTRALNANEKGIAIRRDGGIRIGRLRFVPGRRVCLVAAHKAAKRRWTPLRTAWFVACARASAPGA